MGQCKFTLLDKKREREVGVGGEMKAPQFIVPHFPIHP